jgi:hypothetical protein
MNQMTTMAADGRNRCIGGGGKAGVNDNTAEEGCRQQSTTN